MYFSGSHLDLVLKVTNRDPIIYLGSGPFFLKNQSSDPIFGVLKPVFVGRNRIIFFRGGGSSPDPHFFESR